MTERFQFANINWFFDIHTESKNIEWPESSSGDIPAGSYHYDGEFSHDTTINGIAVSIRLHNMRIVIVQDRCPKVIVNFFEDGTIMLSTQFIAVGKLDWSID